MRALLLLVFLGACLRAELVECENGLLCSAGQVCDLAHGGCVQPEQLDVCIGAVQNQDCATSTVSGGCLDGVCLARGCGNGLVESNEVCDDGNQVSGDACRNDCRSTETCGNGVVDPDVGEDCDDGNLVAHDGCDSGCRFEATAWTLVPQLPRCDAGAYDAGRNVYVCIARDSTWELAALRWTLVATSAPAYSYVYYDPDAARVAAVEAASGVLREWNGASWTQVNAGFGPIQGVVYDPVRRTPIAVGAAGALRSLDASRAWQLEPSGLDLSSFDTDLAYFRYLEFAGGYEPNNQRMVIWGRWFADYYNSCSDNCPAAEGLVSFSSRGGAWTRKFAGGTERKTYDTRHGRWLEHSGGWIYAFAPNGRVRRVDGAGNITTVAGRGGEGHSGDGGAAIAAELAQPAALAIDAAGNLYIADRTNARVRRVDTAGGITTIAGTGLFNSTGDGGPATEAAVVPESLVFDAAGNLYIGGGSRVRVVDTAGIIRPFAGTGGHGDGGDGGLATAALLRSASSLAVDAAGNVYIADSGNCRVRRVTPTGTIATVAGVVGLCGFSGDGPATAARLGYSLSVAVDGAGAIYIADTTNHRIRRVAGGTITTIAGTGTAGFAGDGSSALTAQVSSPTGIAVMSTGTVYFADTGNQRIRRLTPAGMISTIAGTGIHGHSGDGAAATSADIGMPNAVALDATGNLYLTDPGGTQLLGPRTTYAVGDVLYVAALDSLLSVVGPYTVRWDGSTWARQHVDVPAAPTLVADARAGVVVGQSLLSPGSSPQAQTWTFTDRWEITTAEVSPRTAVTMAYDWGRQGPVLFGGIGPTGQPLGDTLLLRNGTWEPLISAGTTPAPGTASAFGYDPELPGLIMVNTGVVYTLESTATAWTTVGTASTVIGPGAAVTSFAYDAASEQLLAMEDNGKIWTRRAGVWVAAPFASTRAGYRLIADERRGRVVMLPLDQGTTQVYEYDAGTWREIEPLPTKVRGSAAYDPATGRIVIVGNSSSLGGPSYSFALVRTTRSSAAAETCAAEADTDGDGASGCDDRDCYWMCDRCPLGATCP